MVTREPLLTIDCPDEAQAFNSSGDRERHSVLDYCDTGILALDLHPQVQKRISVRDSTLLCDWDHHHGNLQALHRVDDVAHRYQKAT